MMRYLACSDDEIARRLYEVVEEETEGLSTGGAGHIDLFVQFAASLGISRDELDAAPLAPATAAHLYYVELVIHKYPWFVVMAAQIAAEGTAAGPWAPWRRAWWRTTIFPPRPCASLRCTWTPTKTTVRSPRRSPSVTCKRPPSRTDARGGLPPPRATLRHLDDRRVRPGSPPIVDIRCVSDGQMAKEC